MDIIYILGNVLLFIILGILLGIAVIVVLLMIYLKTGKAPLGGLFVFLIDLLDSPLKALFRVFRVEDEIVDRAYIEIQNTIMRSGFEKVPYKDRIIFLPQCLRHKDCRASLTRKGIVCIKCGKCKIVKLLNEAEKLGYRAGYVVPGSSFIRRIVKAEKPGAVIGVACMPECKQGIQILMKYGLPGQAIPLLRSGCIDTIADFDRVIEIIRLPKKNSTP